MPAGCLGSGHKGWVGCQMSQGNHSHHLDFFDSLTPVNSCGLCLDNSIGLLLNVFLDNSIMRPS